MNARPNRLEELFESISIRGRYAYALLCFEAIIQSMGLKIRDEAWLDRLWGFTQTKEFYEWWYATIDTIPGLREECDLVFSRELTESEFEKIERALECLTEISTWERPAELRWDDPDRASILKVIDAIAIALDCEAELPKLSLVQFSKFQVWRGGKMGWGSPFTRERLFHAE